MAWNGSEVKGQRGEIKGQRSESRQRNGKNNSPTFNFKALCAGAIVIILGGAAVWFLGRGRSPSGPQLDQQTGRDRARPSQIAEVKPHISTNRPVEKLRKTKKELDDEFIRRCVAKYGTNMPAGLKTHIYYLKNPPKEIYQAERDYPYLKNTADRGIAGVLYVKPGTFFLDCPEFNSKFDEAFADALVNPVMIENDDSDEVREVKQFVNDMKHQIADIVRTEGKKPSELMNEQAKILYDLGRFDEQLAQNLQEAEENPDLTDDDVRDMFVAANELRKKKGLEERAVPTLTHRALDLKRAARRRARETAKKEAEANAAK